MEDEPVGGTAVPYCHLQRVGDEFGAHVVAERPADDLARRQIDDRRQVRPPLPGRDVGDVADVTAVDLGAGTKRTPDQVEGRGRGRVGDGGRTPTFLGPALQARPPHQPAHPTLPAGNTTLPQRPMHPRGPVRALGLRMDRGDLHDELGVEHGASRPLCLATLIEGGTGDLEQTTRVLHAVACGFLHPNERVHAHRVSLAKKAVARLSVSLSSRKRRFSRRNRVSSSRSSVVKPGRSPASVSA